jgi:ADP-heptose:LPS heptosyltransferase
MTERMKLFQPSGTPPSIQLNRMMNLLHTGKPDICFIRGEGIGDVLMTTPTIHAMRQLLSCNATITVATNTRYLEGALVKVLRHNPDIDKVVERDLLKESDYDLIVSLHCPALRLEKKGAKPPNRIDIFANHAGVKLEDPRPRYYSKAEEIDWGRQFFIGKMPNTKTILVHLFSSSSNRSIDNRNIKDALTILNRYHIDSIIIRNDTDPIADIEWSSVPGAQVVNADIRGIAGIMHHCDLVLCPDSSVLHLAGALDVPTVGIFTSTYPGSRINHYHKATAIWDGDSILGCPCWYEYNACHVSHACTAGITGNRIAEQCFKMLKDI